MALSDTERRKQSGQILGKVADKLQGKITSNITDDSGVFAWETAESIVVGRKYVWDRGGGMVSCHAEAVDAAEHEGKGLVMYIADRDAFFGFVPEDIQRSHETNRKGGVLMMNFGFDLGREIPIHEV